jgi:uncharacterized protein (DUF885 family)
MDMTTARLREGLAAGRVQPRIIIDNVVKQLDAMLALPGVEPTVRGYPAEFAQRLVSANFAEIAASRDRLLAEWQRRYDAKSAPR